MILRAGSGTGSQFRHAAVCLTAFRRSGPLRSVRVRRYSSAGECPGRVSHWVVFH